MGHCPNTRQTLVPVRSVRGSHCLWEGGGDLKVNLPLAQGRMRRGQPHSSRLLFRSQPHSACPTHQREGIVADNFGGTFDVQRDGVVGERAYCAEFICDPQYDTRGISAVGKKPGVIRQNRELLIDPFAGVELRDHLLALNVAFNPQISPGVEKWAQVEDERRMRKVSKFASVGISLCNQLVVDVKLEMVAVGADNSVVKSNRFVPARPAEGG